MQLTNQQNGKIGAWTKRPDLADKAELEAMADQLLALPKRRGRRPASSRVCLTEAELATIQTQEVRLVSLGPVRGYRDPATGHLVAHK